MSTDAPIDRDADACAYTEYERGETPEDYPKTGEGAEGVEADVWEALSEVEMTLTYTGCPARDMLTNDVRCAVLTAPGVDSAEVTLRYSPSWNVDMVTEQGRERLREFGLSV